MSGDLAKRLIGQHLKNGWKIVRERTFLPKRTSCNHSITCIADDPDGQQAFVKVLDPTVDRLDAGAPAWPTSTPAAS